MTTAAPGPLLAIDARQEGAAAALNGYSSHANPYLARCPAHNQGRHYYSLRGRCFYCGAPRRDPDRDRLRRAWADGWSEMAEAIRQERVA